MFIDTRAASAPANILPKSKPILHTLRGKDPVELENHGYVSLLSLTFSPFLYPKSKPIWAYINETVKKKHDKAKILTATLIPTSLFQQI